MGGWKGVLVGIRVCVGVNVGVSVSTVDVGVNVGDAGTVCVGEGIVPGDIGPDVNIGDVNF